MADYSELNKEPRNFFLEVQNVTLFGNGNQLRCDLTGDIPLIQYDQCPFKEKSRDTQRRKPCQDEGIDWGDAPTSQGIQRSPAAT